MRRVLSYLLVGGLVYVGVVILFPPGRSRGSLRRASCQSNLKQIGLALREYAADYDECFPSRQWGKSLLVYTKDVQLFQCPETTATQGTTDYFFNSRFLGAPTPRISLPNTLIVIGDGPDDSSLDMTLVNLPEAWRNDENSPAWRHLGTANYAFADGHIKVLQVNHVNRDFRMVK